MSASNKKEKLPQSETAKLKGAIILVAVLLSFLRIIHFDRDTNPLAVASNRSISSYDDFDHHPSIQVALTSSAGGIQYAMRFWANAMYNGWHQDFGSFPIYTFDPVPVKSPLAKLFTQIQPLFKTEQTKKDNNLLLASVEAVYHYNPNADWYLLVEDDTIIVKENLEHAIQALKLDPNELSIHGWCVNQDTKRINGTRLTLRSIVGGSGTLLSRALVKEMVPYVATCRRKYNDIVRSGDGRIGACIQFEMNLPEVVTDEKRCHMCWQYLFSYFDIERAMEKWGDEKSDRNKRIIGLHEKDPEHIQALNKWIRSRPGKDVTLKNMKKDKRLVELVKRDYDGPV